MSDIALLECLYHVRVHPSEKKTSLRIKGTFEINLQVETGTQIPGHQGRAKGNCALNLRLGTCEPGHKRAGKDERVIGIVLLT